MYAQQRFHNFICLALLILPPLLLASPQSNDRTYRRRPSLQAQQSVDDVTEKSASVPDQLALAANHNDANQYRRRSFYPKRSDEDYNYGNFEMNLIRPEHEAAHTKITAKYTSSISTGGIARLQPNEEDSSLEDAETAEEYVARAMQMYGARLREPIRIPSTEADDGQQQQQHQQQQHTQQPEQPLPPRVAEQEQSAEMNTASMQSQSYPMSDNHASPEEGSNAPLLGTTNDPSGAAAAASASSQSTTSTYEKDPVTRSYEVYDNDNDNDNNNNNNERSTASQIPDPDNVDRHYRTKYVYQPSYHDGGGSQREEKVRVSASTDIPKSEIMKQIEKSVMKYMRELEAEGKILTAPQETPKSYYKVIAVPSEDDDDKYTTTTTTTRPKYSSVPSGSYHGTFDGTGSSSSLSSSSSGLGSSSSATSISSSSSSSSKSAPGRHHMPKLSLKPQYQSETETTYQPHSHSLANHHHQQQDMSDALAPNVEFIYKIKTRAPLQTATVKTVSKPYSLPIKGATTYEQFDHSAAIKNMEDFDLSHVVTGREPDDHSSVTSKPSKLYFNSEIYHDINSLPFKPSKSRPNSGDYRKLKTSDLPNGSDYKGYTGYYAEPGGNEDDNKSESFGNSDDGYPIMNPYKFILKREPMPNKYDDVGGSSNWEQPRPSHSKTLYSSITPQKTIDHDNYNTKFNNNPETYGYQHTYKSHTGRHVNTKRGKRGGGAHPHPGGNGKKGVSHREGNLSLRPVSSKN